MTPISRKAWQMHVGRGPPTCQWSAGSSGLLDTIAQSPEAVPTTAPRFLRLYTQSLRENMPWAVTSMTPAVRVNHLWVGEGAFCSRWPRSQSGYVAFRIPRPPGPMPAYPGRSGRGCGHSPTRTPPADCQSPACTWPNPGRSPRSRRSFSGRPVGCKRAEDVGPQPRGTCACRPQNAMGSVPWHGHGGLSTDPRDGQDAHVGRRRDQRSREGRQHAHSHTAGWLGLLLVLAPGLDFPCPLATPHILSLVKGLWALRVAHREPEAQRRERPPETALPRAQSLVWGVPRDHTAVPEVPVLTVQPPPSVSMSHSTVRGWQSGM